MVYVDLFGEAVAFDSDLSRYTTLTPLTGYFYFAGAHAVIKVVLILLNSVELCKCE